MVTDRKGNTMRTIITLAIITVGLAVAGAASARPVGDMPVTDGYYCPTPGTNSGPYYQSGEYFPGYSGLIFAWIGPNSYIQRQGVWSPYQLICEYQSVAGHLAWVSTVG